MINGIHSPLGKQSKLGENLGEKYGEIFALIFSVISRLMFNKVYRKKILVQVAFFLQPPALPFAYLNYRLLRVIIVCSGKLALLIAKKKQSGQRWPIFGQDLQPLPIRCCFFHQDIQHELHRSGGQLSAVRFACFRLVPGTPAQAFFSNPVNQDFYAKGPLL